jgi:hypothetical protein
MNRLVNLSGGYYGSQGTMSENREESVMETMDRLQRLVDRVEIIDLKHAYARYADAMRPDLMVSRFVPECTARYQPGGELISGRDALLEWYSTQLGTVVASSHHMSNFEVTFADADHADLRCYLYSWQRFAQFPAEADRHRWARYEDTWVRTEDGWFQSSLNYLIAGELSSDEVLRQGEYLGQPL